MRRFTFMISIIACLLFSSCNSPIREITADPITINPGMQYQTMDGWGTNLAWWAGQVGTWSDPVRSELMDLIFGQEGLNLNIVRYNWGGGISTSNPEHDTHGDTYSMHPSRKLDSLATGYDEAKRRIIYDFSLDPGQQWVVKELVTNPDYQVNYMEAQVNSPPWWMTISGSAAGNVSQWDENLAPETYDLYIEYLIEMLKYFEAQGVVFDHLNPFNEPISGYWKKGGNQEGSYFGAATQQVILNKLHAKLKAEGLATKITASDETSSDHAVDTFNYFDDETKSMISRLNAHSYSGTERTQLRDLALSYGKTLWMSEFSTGYIQFNPDGMETATALANMIFKDIGEMGVSAWVIWKAVEDRIENLVNLNRGKDYMTAWKPSGSWGLINADYDDLDLADTLGPDYVFKRESYITTKQYDVMKQFSAFIHEGYTIIDADHEDVMAAMSPEGQLVVVVKNFTDDPKETTLDLSAFDDHANVAQVYQTSNTQSTEPMEDVKIKDSMMIISLPKQSLTTYVIEDVAYHGAISHIINNNVIGTSENQMHYSGVWHMNQEADSYSRDVHFSNYTSSSLNLQFMGNRVQVYGANSINSGIAEVVVDNGEPIEIDLYEEDKRSNQVLFDSGILEDGSHTLVVTITGDKNLASRGTYLYVDYAVVTKAQ